MDHLALFTFDDALARADVDECPQLLLAEHHLLHAFAADEPHRQRRQSREGGTHGRQEYAEPRHRPAGEGQEPFRVLDRERHRQDFAEGREDEDQHDHFDEHPPARAEETVGDRRGDRGGPDVDHRDADQERDEQLVRALDERLRRAAGFALRGDLSEPGAAQGEVRGLGAGEDRGADDEDAEGQEP